MLGNSPYISSFLELDDEIIEILNTAKIFTVDQLISRRYIDFINNEGKKLKYPQYIQIKEFVKELGLQFKPETWYSGFIRSLKYIKFDTWKKSIDIRSFFNILFLIENSQGDINFILVMCVLGRSVKITLPYWGKRWSNFHGAYILYWKLIGNKNDNKYGVKTLFIVGK